MKLLEVQIDNKLKDDVKEVLSNIDVMAQSGGFGVKVDNLPRFDIESLTARDTAVAMRIISQYPQLKQMIIKRFKLQNTLASNLVPYVIAICDPTYQYIRQVDIIADITGWDNNQFIGFSKLLQKYHDPATSMMYYDEQFAPETIATNGDHIVEFPELYSVVGEGYRGGEISFLEMPSPEMFRTFETNTINEIKKLLKQIGILGSVQVAVDVYGEHYVDEPRGY